MIELKREQSEVSKQASEHTFNERKVQIRIQKAEF